MFDLNAFGPLLVSVGFIALLVQFSPRNGLVRVIFSCLCIFLAARYVWWRFEYSMPLNQNPLQTAWSWVFFIFEAMSIVSSTSVIMFMSRPGGRTPPVHCPEDLINAPVDVFIATYNEPYNILERTIVGAKAINHPDLRVWILDDGARDWVKELADDLSIHYVRRVRGLHAKAGNINNGLQHALATGRSPKFVLVLDADFIPNRNILKRTLGFFQEPDIGIVQTPQHFFNPDPIQTNLAVTRVWPDEQRFFFNTLLACKDAWGAAFCCGTSAVFRVEALVAAGGMATETVTEDMLTSFKLREHGFRTVFLNEILSLGLAPEGLSSYISQRTRWCLGAIQQLYTRWSFFGPAKIGLINRISFLDGVLYWASNAAFKLLMITGPVVYWWSRTAVISSTLDSLLIYLAPFFVCSVLFMGFYANKRILPVMTDVTQLLTSVSLVTTVAVAFVKPFGHPFKVTAKGISADRVVVQWRYMIPFGAIAVATVVGIVCNTSQFSPLYGTDGYAVNVFWSIFNVAVLVVACAACVEVPRRRVEERFNSGEAATIQLTNGMQVPCVVRDVSLGGADIVLNFGRLRADDRGTLVLPSGIEAPFVQVRRGTDDIAIRFELDSQTRRKLIALLFTGEYANEVQQVSLRRVFGGIVRRLAT
jgi:cellulose synthase (UDP-forming)